MRYLLSLCFSALVVMMGMQSSASAGESTSFESKTHNVRFSLPSARFSVVDDKSSTTYRYMEIADRAKMVTILFSAWVYNAEESQFPSAKEWALSYLNSLTNKKKGAWYTGGLPTTEDRSKRETTSVVLGSGEPAFVVRSELKINGHTRQVAFIYWERTTPSGNERVWYQFFLGTQKDGVDLSDSISQLAQSIEYMVPLPAPISLN